MNQSSGVLHKNSRMLVEELESLSSLEDRFEELKLVNVIDGKKFGYFSLIFVAKDVTSNNLVAIKFFDQDPQKQNAYRMQCFKREQELLKGLKDAYRCLQLVAPLATYEFNYGEISIPARFFVTEWLSGNLDGFFYGDSADPIQKLYAFHDVILAVESLHSRGIFHRDLKADNFRVRENADQNVVVAIDLGTAASFESAAILESYGHPAGDTQYSSPEASCGLAGHRQLAPQTDVYALGCLLYELFSDDLFYTTYRNLNPDFETRLMAIRSRIDPAADFIDQIASWDRFAPKFLQGLAPLQLEWSENACSAPLAIIDILNRVLIDLTAPNFRSRENSLAKTRERLRSCIRCLENEKLAKVRSDKAREWRLLRRAKAAKRIERARVHAHALSCGGS